MFDSRYLTHIFRDHKFTFQGLELSAGDVLTERGFLSVIAYYADETSRYLFKGLGIGIDLIADDNTMLGQRVHFVESVVSGVPESLRAPLMLHATMEVLGITFEPALVNLDPLYDRLSKGEPICGPM
jgi:hypothetical protein